MLSLTTACFTGHRPKSLPGGYNYSSAQNLELQSKLRVVCEDLITNHSVDTFVCGGALGVDQMGFIVVNGLKKSYPQIKTVLALPFANQSSAWLESSKHMHESHTKLADSVILVDENPNYAYGEPKIYHPAKMKARNRFMVDSSNFVIAVWSGSPSGGTYDCIKYAQSQKKEIIKIDV